MKTLVATVLLVCTSAHAFNINPDQKLPPHITYSCSDDDESVLLGAFKIWNHACDGYFTFERVNDGAVLSVVTRSIGFGFQGLTAQQGFTAKISIDTGARDRAAVMLHEVGHAFGMNHSTDPNAVMSLVDHEFINQDDIDGIRTIYGLSPKEFGPTILQRAHGVKVIGSFEAMVVIISDGFITTKRVFVHRLPRGLFTLQFYCDGIYGTRDLAIP